MDSVAYASVIIPLSIQWMTNFISFLYCKYNIKKDTIIKQEMKNFNPFILYRVSEYKKFIHIPYSYADDYQLVSCGGESR